MSLKLKLNKERMLNDGTYPLVFQVILRRRKKLIYTSYRLLEQEFLPERERVCACRGGTLSRGRAAQLNAELERRRSELSSLLGQVQRAGGSLDDFATACRIGRREETLFAFIRSEIARREASRCDGTAAAYRSTLRSLERYACGRDCRLDEVSSRFVHGYALYLQGCGLQPNTIGFYLRNFRALYNLAVGGRGQDGGSPFRRVPIRIEQTPKRGISLAELARIRDLPLEGRPGWALSRDIFLFSFYARGMSLVDVIGLRRDRIADGQFTYSRTKTHQLIRVGLNAPMREIIARYDNPGPYLFPVTGDPLRELTYQDYRTALGRVNRHLKSIARMAGLQANLTSYVARHSWASIAREVGTPVSVISESLGHTSERTTRIYLRKLDRDILDRANERVLSALEGVAAASSGL